VARQQQDCTELARRNGWQVAGTFIDNDVSAYSGKPRLCNTPS
jgi:site-specific DNA recombinase